MLVRLDEGAADRPRVRVALPVQSRDRRLRGRAARSAARRPGGRRLLLRRPHPGDRRRRLPPPGRAGPARGGDPERQRSSWCASQPCRKPPAASSRSSSSWPRAARAKGRAQLVLEGDPRCRLPAVPGRRRQPGPARGSPAHRLRRRPARRRGSRASPTPPSPTRPCPASRRRSRSSIRITSKALDRGGSLQAGGLRQFPESRDLEKVAEVAAADPGAGVLEQRWTFTLPEGSCAPEAKDEKSKTRSASFSTSVKGEGRQGRELEAPRRAAPPVGGESRLPGA